MNCCELPKCNMWRGREGWISQFSNISECGNWKIISSVAYRRRRQNYLYSLFSGVSSHFLTFDSCPQLSLSAVSGGLRHRALLSLSLRYTIKHPVFPLESPCLLFQKYHFSARSHGYQQSWGFLSLGTRPMRRFWVHDASSHCFIKAIGDMK